MSDKAPPSGSARNAKPPALSARGRRLTNTAPPPIIGGPRPQMKTTGGKFLLPSKMKPMSTLPEGPLKTRAVQSRRGESERQVDEIYELFLLNFVQTAFLEDENSLLEHEHLESGATKTVEMIACSDESVRIFVNKLVLKLWKDLKQLEIISGAFDNLPDFAGEETLVEIQTLLMKKFEKINVNGAVLEEPIFHGIEMEKIVDKVRNHLTGNVDQSKVIGYVKAFKEVMNKLDAASSKSEMMNENLQYKTKFVLENCSLSICEKACESYKAEQEELDCENEGKKDEEGIKLDED